MIRIILFLVYVAIGMAVFTTEHPNYKNEMTADGVIVSILLWPAYPAKRFYAGLIGEQ